MESMKEAVSSLADSVPFFHSMPEPIQIFIIGMVPIIELRWAIPYGMAVLKMSAFESVFWSVLWNAMTNALFLAALPRVCEFLRKRSRFFSSALARLHYEHKEGFKRKWSIFLVLFVSIPIPGSWSFVWCILAYLFGLDFKRSLLVVTLGVVLSWIIITSMTLGVLGIVWILS